MCFHTISQISRRNHEEAEKETFTEVMARVALEAMKGVKKVGQLTMEVEFLEKSADNWESQSKNVADRARFSIKYTQPVTVTAYPSFNDLL